VTAADITAADVNGPGVNGPDGNTPEANEPAVNEPAVNDPDVNATAVNASDGDGLSRAWLAPFPLDIRRVLGVHRRGGGDPTFRIDASGAVWRTSLTPAGPGTLRVTARAAEPPAAFAPPAAFPLPAALPPADPPSPPAPPAPPAQQHDFGVAALPATHVAARAWGPGAGWLLAALPDLLGASDEPESFQPVHPLLRELTARHPGVRIGRTGRVLEALVPAVLEQKVVGLEAFRSWRLLIRRFGLPAPGPAPAGLRVFPPPATWAAIPSWEWHRAGVEGVRAATIIGAARVAGRLEQIAALPAASADRRLRSLPGVGPWTSAEIRQRACGDPDAVSVGDYNLPAAVGWALAGRKVDDAGMLELLAPYPGHRHRATRLIELSGIRPPRHGHRMAVRDYRKF
jgi:3-methyladenine DNA glycosylase/8-oxoguanine DNA glycosylase